MLFGLVLAVGTAGMTMGADLAGSEWRPSFMSAAELPAGITMQVLSCTGMQALAGLEPYRLQELHAKLS